jgi:hypothetical protein
MKNKNLYNLSFRANSSFGYGSSQRPIPDSHLETNPNSNFELKKKKNWWFMWLVTNLEVDNISKKLLWEHFKF